MNFGDEPSATPQTKFAKVRTLLVLAEHPELAESIRAALNPGEFRVVHRLTLEEAEPLLVHGLVHACILDMDAVGAQAVWMIEKIHRRLAKLPLDTKPDRV